MKIERINENQIRCTLSKNDLLERHLKISELAYGSEKARELFRDMMEQANIDFGFDADDIPLMIEAIPTSRDSIVLLITKVDNPEEFDEKFSRFGLGNDSYSEDEELDFDSEFSDEENEGNLLESPDIVNCFEQLHDLIDEVESKNENDKSQFIPLSEALQNRQKKKQDKKRKKQDNFSDKVKVFSFVSMNPIIEASHRVTDDYNGKNTLWKDDKGNRYYLLLNRGNAKSAFQSACTVVSEYGKEEMMTYATQDYFNEHYKIIIKDKALNQLSLL